MRWSEIGDQRCSIARTLSVVGERWTMLILREAFLRTRRFDDIQRNTGAPRPVLAERLRRLVEAGILERRPYGTHPDRYEYRLTDKGLDLYPVVIGLLNWGDRWMAGDGRPPLKLRHTDCGEVVNPELSCPACNDPIGPRDMSPELTPDNSVP